MQINVKYFAALRDSTNVSEEVVETNALTADELFEELNQKYNFTVNKDDLRVALNESYQNFNSTIKNNDTIVFIPPVAGG